VSITEIAAMDGLDPITVFWNDIGPSGGSVTITCFGAAWTAYFRATGNRTIQQFVRDADVDYLITKLGITPFLKQRKTDRVYLGRLIRAVKKTLEVSTD
jgi:hypothetical protein